MSEWEDSSKHKINEIFIMRSAVEALNLPDQAESSF